MGEGGWDLCGGWPASEDKEAAWRENVYIIGGGILCSFLQLLSLSAAYSIHTIIKQTRTTFYIDADGLRGCCFAFAVSSMNDN